MPFARTTLDGILNALKGTNYSWPATVYVALLTTQPTDNQGTGIVEVAAGSSAGQWSGYARQSVTTSTGWSAISGSSTRQISNGATISFGTVTLFSNSSTLVLTGFAIYDASTAGNLLGYGGLTQGGSAITPTLNNGDACPFAAGQLVLSEV